MVTMTQSMEQFLWRFHRDKMVLILLGHTELFTEEIGKEYVAWCRSEEGHEYLAGGSKYNPKHKGNMLIEKEIKTE